MNLEQAVEAEWRGVAELNTLRWRIKPAIAVWGRSGEAHRPAGRGLPKRRAQSKRQIALNPITGLLSEACLPLPLRKIRSGVPHPVRRSAVSRREPYISER